MYHQPRLNFTFQNFPISYWDNLFFSWVNLFNKYDIDQSTRLFIHTPKSPFSCVAVALAYQLKIPYVPVDSSFPLNRTLSVFDSVLPQWILIDKEIAFFEYLTTHFTTQIVWEHGNTQLLQVQHPTNLRHPENLAAILFTSGSTGVPKGVMISRLNIQVFVNWMVQEYNITNSSKILSVSPLNFDLSVFELFACFKTGAQFCFPDSFGMVNPMLIANTIKQNVVNVVYATPTWYQLLLSYGKIKSGEVNFVQTILVAGEPFNSELALRLHSLFPNAIIANLYGPTETNVCTFYNLDFTTKIKTNVGIVSIGKACPYCTTTLSENNMLVVSGQSTMLGYWPVQTNSDTYNTGDVVMVDGDQDFFFVERLDGMIKRNGFRIERSEIEACVLKLEGVLGVALVAQRLNNTTKIVVFFTGNCMDSMVLRNHCSVYLPSYMLPDEYIHLDAMPLTSSGKIDYKRLERL